MPLNCGTMVGIRSVVVGVGERQLEDSFVCFGAKLTQRACAGWKTMKDDERQGPRAVNR